MNNIKIRVFATAALTTAFNDKNKQMTDILVNLRDGNSTTVTRKILISLHFSLNCLYSMWCNQKTKHQLCRTSIRSIVTIQG